MRYAIAFLCPPLAVLLCGKPFQACLLSGPLWLLSIVLLFFGVGLLLWLVLTIHAFAVISSHTAQVSIHDAVARTRR